MQTIISISTTEETFTRLFEMWVKRTVIPSEIYLDYYDKHDNEKTFVVQVDYEDIEDIAREKFSEEFDEEGTSGWTQEELYEEYEYLFNFAFKNYEDDLKENVYALVAKAEDNWEVEQADARHEHYIETEDGLW